MYFQLIPDDNSKLQNLTPKQTGHIDTMLDQCWADVVEIWLRIDGEMSQIHF